LYAAAVKVNIQPTRSSPRCRSFRTSPMLFIFGDSSTGVEIWVAVGPFKKEWSVLMRRDAREWPLLAALAFIHVEWWNYD
jgi:hypothetical protein